MVKQVFNSSFIKIVKLIVFAYFDLLRSFFPIQNIFLEVELVFSQILK
jgi:hypothetical protein